MDVKEADSDTSQEKDLHKTEAAAEQGTINSSEVDKTEFAKSRPKKRRRVFQRPKSSATPDLVESGNNQRAKRYDDDDDFFSRRSEVRFEEVGDGEFRTKEVEGSEVSTMKPGFSAEDRSERASTLEIGTRKDTDSSGSVLMGLENVDTVQKPSTGGINDVDGPKDFAEIEEELGDKFEENHDKRSDGALHTDFDNQGGNIIQRRDNIVEKDIDESDPDYSEHHSSELWAIDDSALLEDDDIEILDESKTLSDRTLRSQSRNRNAESAGKIETVIDLDLDDSDDGNDSSGPTSKERLANRDVEEQEIQTYLDMGFDYALAKQMIAEKKRTKAGSNLSSFTVSVRINSRNEELSRYNTTIDIQSSDRFEKLKSDYLLHLERQGVSQGSGLYQLAFGSGFVAHNVQIMSSSTPQVLNVSSLDPILTVSLMSQQEFMEMREKRRQESLRSLEKVRSAGSKGSEEKEEDGDSNRGAANSNGTDQKGIMADLEENNVPVDVEEQSSFRIVMRGADQLEYDVKVRPGTQISSLVSFYRKKCAIPDKVKIRLEFDDEPLDVNGTVGETELEEDFTIDVFTSQ